MTSQTRNSLVSVARTLGYASLATEIAGDPECRAHLADLAARRPVPDRARRLPVVAHRLPAGCGPGLINIEQNGIIKFFSVVAVVFMPPTLIASIYGMNFDEMPELHWFFGYPWALLLMVISGVTPFIWVKRKGWL